MKERNDIKKIKIGKFSTNIGELILIILLIIGLILVFTSPKVALIVTQKYNQGTEDENNNVKIAFGEENTEEKFKLYFWWYNVLHEVGHGLIYYNGNNNMSGPEKEQLVNDFAYAYWSYYGEQDKLDELEPIINYAVEHIKNDENSNMNYMEYARENWNKESFGTFNNYGYFQFNSVSETFKNKKTLEEVLKEMGITNANLSNTKQLNYEYIDKDTCNKILYDAIDNVHEWGLEFPDTYHKYNTNPYYSYFRASNKFYYSITNLFDKSLSD